MGSLLGGFLSQRGEGGVWRLGGYVTLMWSEEEAMGSGAWRMAKGRMERGRLVWQPIATRGAAKEGGLAGSRTQLRWSRVGWLKQGHTRWGKTVEGPGWEREEDRGTAWGEINGLGPR
jgi:hypothetical protein